MRHKRVIKGFGQALWDLREGRITFDAFYKLTLNDWRGLAVYILRRWEVPAGTDQDEVVQELVMAAWQFVGKYEPAKCSDFHRYIVFNAVDKAQKWLHKQRGAVLHGNAGANPSRHPIAAGIGFAFAEQHEQHKRLRCACEPATPATQEESTDAYASALKLCENEREALVLQALHQTGGSPIAAAQMLYENPASRLRCRLLCEKHAEQIVHRSLTSLAARVCAAA